MMTDEKTRSTADEVSTAVIEAVASAKGVAELDLPPLNDVVDPDALDALFEPQDETQDVGMVTFTYADCDVTVFSDGDVDVST